VREGFYTNLTIHRIVSGFVIQGGDPNGDGTGGPGFTFQNEITPLSDYYGTGQLAMANSGANTNGSQFFITLAPNSSSLDGNYTLFGQLVEGFNVLNTIAALPVGGTSGSTPTNPPVILSAQIVSAPTDTVLLVQAPKNYNGDALITVTGTDGSSSATQTFHVQVGTGGTALQNIQFVNRVYGDILNRVPEASTVTSLSNALNSGAITPQQLVYMVQTSQEARIDQVTNVYSTLLNRKPTSQEYSTGVAFLSGGGSLATLEAKVISTEEYFDDQGGTNSAWITGVLTQATGDSTVSPAYISYVSNELNTGLSMTRYAQSVFDSQGAAIHTVQTLFNTFLSRTPASNDPSIQGLVTALMDGVSQDLIIVTIATSPEFYAKL
jgi:cyclophilin family peptidyl-prolyl cis-trans isomerase